MIININQDYDIVVNAINIVFINCPMIVKLLYNLSACSSSTITISSNDIIIIGDG